MLVCVSRAFLSWVLSSGTIPESWPALDDAKPKPLTTFSLKAEDAARPDLHWMAFTPSGGLLAVRYADPRSEDATLEVFDTATGKPVTSVAIKGGGGFENRRPTCAIAPSGEWIAYGKGPNLRFLALPPGKPVLPGRGAIEIHSKGGKDSASVWLDGKGQTAFVYRDQAFLPTLERWDFAKQSGEKVVQTPPERATLHAATLHPATRRLAISAKFDGEKPWIEFWTLADKPTKATTETKVRAQSLAYSPDGAILAAGFEDGSLSWYDAATGKAIKRIALPGGFTVGSVSVHSGGKHFACGTFQKGAPNLFLVDVVSGEVVAKLLADANGVTSACFSPNGDKLAVFGSSGTVTIWDATKLLKLERD